MKYFYSILLFSTCFIFSTLSFAQNKVFLNNVDITGIKGQRFENVTAYFDQVGDLHLNAPQYQVSIQSNNTTTQQNYAPIQQNYAPPQQQAVVANHQSPTSTQQIPTNPNQITQIQAQVGKPSKSHYLVAFSSNPGLLGFDIEVYVNGNKTLVIGQTKAQTVEDITTKLVRGENRIQYHLVLAADSGKYSKAQTEIFVAVQTAAQGNQLELSGEQGKIVIRGDDEADKWYETTIIAE